MDKTSRGNLLGSKGARKGEMGGADETWLSTRLGRLAKRRGAGQREGGRVLCSMDGKTRL